MNVLDEIEEDKIKPIELEFKHEKGLLSYQHKIMQLGFAIFLFITLSMIISAIAGLFLKSFYGLSIGDIINDVDYFFSTFKGKYNGVRFYQMSNTMGFGLAAIAMSYLITGKLFKFFKFNSSANWVSVILIPFIFVSVLPVIAFIAFQLGKLNLPAPFLEMEKNMLMLQEGLISVPVFSIFLINFIMIAVFPAVFEELFFRGVIQKLMIQLLGKHNSHHGGIIITGIIFGAIHMQITNFIPIALLGILLGYIYWWTKNLWFPIIAHLFFNGIQATSFFIYSTHPNLSDVQQLEVFPNHITFFSLIVFIGLTYLFFSLNKTTAYEPS